MDKEKMDALKRGEIVEINGKLYAICQDCKSLVRVDKPLFGAYHFCK